VTAKHTRRAIPIRLDPVDLALLSVLHPEPGAAPVAAVPELDGMAVAERTITNADYRELSQRIMQQAARAARAIAVEPPADDAAPLRLIKIRPAIGGSWLILEVHPDDFGGFAEEMRAAGPGERYTVEVAEMTRAELDALPEFEGW